MDMKSPEGLITTLATTGAVIGFGQLLMSAEELKLRRVFGRMIASAALGACAPLILVITPDAPLPVVFAAGCALVSLGVSGLERLLARITGPKTEEAPK